ncbi:hypothetical protein BKA62DRAFT_622949 [Auriculariales sp. MPI-PUGE-AT-0066]|nr:hypothetical protein BKA62DRAFT_622949 [Auriculariales sp. MPI-PUGE-AT-0066]
MSNGEPNPWNDEKPLPANPSGPGQGLTVTTTDISEFDPLGQAAIEQQVAWADEEGHPPATPTKNGQREPNEHVIPPPKSASSLSFPVLSAITKTFARATTPRAQSPPPPASPSPQPQQLAQDQTKQAAKEVPFDFQRFLEQMKMRSAEPVAKYLRSFLSNFSKKTFTVNDQVKLIHNFLSFISEKMREVEPWKNAPELEFDNAIEAMEKLVMNKLYDHTFTPQVERTGRPVTTDDLERDHVLEQRIRLFSWINEGHLDVPNGENVHGFYQFAEQELLKVNHYKAPRDKLICILNSCKVIFGLIRHAHADEGADSFLPILIFVVLRAHPEHLISNVEYINRFRRANKLQSEAGYYLSSLMGAISFIETMDHTSLSNLTQEEFEQNVETAIQELPPSPDLPASAELPSGPKVDSPMAGEESARPLQLPTSSTIAEDTKRFLQRTGDLAQAAQQSISKPLNAIGRIFNEVIDTAEERLRLNQGGPTSPQQEQQRQRQEQGQGYPGGLWSPDTPLRSANPDYQQQQQQQYFPTTYEPRIRGSSPGASPGPGPAPHAPKPIQYQHQQMLLHQQQQLQAQQQPYHLADPSSIARTTTPALDFGVLSHEIERIDAAHRAARDAAADTLLQIFPTAEREVAEMILEANDGDLGKSIEALLEMTGGGSLPGSIPASLVASPDPQVQEARARSSPQPVLSVADQQQPSIPESSDAAASFKPLYTPPIAPFAPAPELISVEESVPAPTLAATSSTQPTSPTLKNAPS